MKMLTENFIRKMIVTIVNLATAYSENLTDERAENESFR